MLDPGKLYTPADFRLIDDGTVDTVVMLPDGTKRRYSDASDYRTHGWLDFPRWVTDVGIPDMDADDALWPEE